MIKINFYTTITIVWHVYTFSFPFFATTTAEGLLRSTGIVIAVIVFPMGLGLLVASCVCLKEPTTEEEEPQAKKQPSKGIYLL